MARDRTLKVHQGVTEDMGGKRTSYTKPRFLRSPPAERAEYGKEVLEELSNRLIGEFGWFFPFRLYER